MKEIAGSAEIAVTTHKCIVYQNPGGNIWHFKGREYVIIWPNKLKFLPWREGFGMGERCVNCGRLDSTANLSDINVHVRNSLGFVLGSHIYYGVWFLCRAFVMGCAMLHVHAILFWWECSRKQLKVPSSGSHLPRRKVMLFRKVYTSSGVYSRE
jgi:hypothetical protein